MEEETFFVINKAQGAFRRKFYAHIAAAGGISVHLVFHCLVRNLN